MYISSISAMVSYVRYIFLAEATVFLVPESY
jgi:hypothetical protein